MQVPRYLELVSEDFGTGANFSGCIVTHVAWVDLVSGISLSVVACELAVSISCVLNSGLIDF